MMAAMNDNHAAGLVEFDKAIFGHIGFIMSNKVRAFVLGLTNGRLARAPSGPLKRYYQQFSRFSAALAYMADMAMVTMGGELKRAEKLSARYGDLLSHLYVGSCVLKFYTEANSPQEELPIVEWICQDLLFKMQKQLDGLLSNFPNRLLGKILRYGVIFPRGRYLCPPSDHLGAKVAQLITEPSSFRERMAKDLYMTPNDNNPAGKAIHILEKVIAVEPLEKKLAAARRDYPSQAKTREEWMGVALSHNVITSEEAELLNKTFIEKMNAINVDDFAPEMFQPHHSE
jgi:acyl-CoA dehydrogenase